MNSKEFVQACEDGKTLVWGVNGLRTIHKSEKKFSYIDLSSGFALAFDRVEMSGEKHVFILVDEIPIGVIPTEAWDLLFKKVKE